MKDFEKCNTPLEISQCEKCGKEGVQLYFRGYDLDGIADGDYWCADCVKGCNYER